MPRMPEIVAIANATRSRGNWSRTIPNASGKIAPPSPWIVLAVIITGSVVARPPSSAADREAAERDHEHALLAEHVAEAPRDRRHDGRGEQVRREHPRDTRGRGVQVLLDHRQGRHHERLQQRVRRPAEREHGKNHPWPSGLGGALGHLRGN